MAGWMDWTELQITVGTSVAKTVLPTLWPSIQGIAAAQGWRAWQDVMLAKVTESIVYVKKQESPSLNRDDIAAEAVAAGEMWAHPFYHDGVLRFEDADAAKEWLMTNVRAHPPTRPSAAEIEALRLTPAAHHFDAAGTVVDWNRVSFDSWVVITYTRSRQAECSTDVLQALTHYVTGMCKMGTMTEQWRRSREAQVRKDAQNQDISLDRHVAERVWDFYGVAFKPTDENYPALFAFIHHNCSRKNLTRLFVTAMQAAQQGCTVLNLIQDAMTLCSNFNWNRIIDGRTPPERVLNGEYKKFVTDFEAMVADPFLRFKGKAGRAPELANLGYLAKRLLTRARGVTSIENYAGLDQGNLTISQKVWIDRVVAKYIEEVTAQQDADMGSFLVANAAEIPVDLGHVPTLPDFVAPPLPENLRLGGAYRPDFRAQAIVPGRQDARNRPPPGDDNPEV